MKLKILQIKKLPKFYLKIIENSQIKACFKLKMSKITN